jgi:hypothetical protein
MLAVHPVLNFIFDILPRDPLGWLRSYELLNRNNPCKLVSDFIPSYPSISSDPKEPHIAPRRKLH